MQFSPLTVSQFCDVFDLLLKLLSMLSLVVVESLGEVVDIIRLQLELVQTWLELHGIEQSANLLLAFNLLLSLLCLLAHFGVLAF